MKKALVILVVLAMAAPLYADTITFSAGAASGTIEYVATGAIAPVAMALDVDADGTITAVAVDSFFDIFMDAAHDEEVVLAGSYVYGAGTPIANQDAVGELALPAQNFCISMGGLGGEEEPLDAAPMSGVITLTAGTATSATIEANALRGGVVGTDGVEMTVTGFPLVVGTGTPPCIAVGHADYAEWDALGQPPQWCAPSQCYGDADGAQEKIGRLFFDVGYADIDVLIAGFSVAYVDPVTTDWIGADFTRTEEKIGRLFFRVGYADIDVLIANFSTNPAGDCND